MTSCRKMTQGQADDTELKMANASFGTYKSCQEGNAIEAAAGYLNKKELRLTTASKDDLCVGHRSSR